MLTVRSRSALLTMPRISWAASDVYAPIAGTVVAGNAALADAPEVVNADPYGEGWLLKLTPADAAALNGLMNAGEYQAFVESE
jgi:glycine cleavage system H protein